MNPPFDPSVQLGLERVRTEALLTQLMVDFEALVHASVDANADDEHDPEGTTIGYERAQLTTLMAQARSRLIELERAEGRLHDTTYGRCETCGELISAQRLSVRPSACECIRCATGRR